PCTAAYALPLHDALPIFGRWGRELLAAVNRAESLTETALPQWPHRPRPRMPGAVSRRVEALRRWRAAATTRVGLEPGALLPNRRSEERRVGQEVRTAAPA